MSRAQRLLDLIQVFRRYRRPVSGAALAQELGISLRTLYRDIDTLRVQGAPIDGEAGVGYVLRPGFMLPPLMFSEDEIEALVLGSQWVAKRTDNRLGEAARNAVAKIGAVLPRDLKDRLDDQTLLIGPPNTPVLEKEVDVRTLREIIRIEQKIRIKYRDENGEVTNRTIWPFAMAFFDNARVIVAWCELRQGFRHFRIDRILGHRNLDRKYPRRRQSLMKEWREQQNIPPQ